MIARIARVLTSAAWKPKFVQMRALICTGGDAPESDFLRGIAPGYGLVIAADSGLETALNAGLEVDRIIGDMDSLTDAGLLARFPEEKIHRYPKAKDFTDTELAIDLAWKLGATSVTIAGGGGGRIDHLLAIRALFERPNPPCAWHVADESIYLIAEGKDFRLDCRPGTRVSVFPLSAGCSGMGSEGLSWPLDALSWGPGGFGISNCSVGSGFSVRAGRGALLLIVERYGTLR